MKKEKSLNKLVKKFRYKQLSFEVDRLLDQKPAIYHLFIVSKTDKKGLNIGGDFTSKKEAIEFVYENYE